MVVARATQAERMAQEKTVLLATARAEVIEAAQRVSILGDELVSVHRAWDAAEEEILILTARAAVADQQREMSEEHCERLVHELILLSLRGSKLRITITSAPRLAPLHEGMHFVVAQQTEVATQLSTLRAVVSLAAQSILGHLPIDISQAGIVGVMVVRFQEQADWCSCLEVSGSKVCGLVL
jgi:hypothetical protein